MPVPAAPDQIEGDREALRRGVSEALARDLDCYPSEDVLGLLVDRALARAGMLPREGLAERTAEQRAVMLAGMTEEEACADLSRDLPRGRHGTT